jgi:thiol-disulfide isomerase/thioredoxin
MAAQSIKILEFSAPLCSACQNVYETISSVIKESDYAGRVEFEKVNGLENIPLLTQYDLADGEQLLEETAFPITIFIKNQEEVLRKFNEFDKKELRSTLDHLLPQSSKLDQFQPQGAIIIRAFHEGDEQAEDFQKNKATIKALMGHEKLHRRIHFEWQSRTALFARRYELDKHPAGQVTILFNKEGEEAGRIEGVFNRNLLEDSVIKVFQGQQLGTISLGNQPQSTATSKPKEEKETPKFNYAEQPQRKLQIIEFIQDNCASCNALEPTIQQIGEKYKDWLTVFKINGDDHPDAKAQWLKHAKGHMMFYPIVLLTDEDGQVLYNSDDYKKLQEELDTRIRHFLYLEMA